MQPCTRNEISLPPVFAASPFQYTQFPPDLQVPNSFPYIYTPIYYSVMNVLCLEPCYSSSVSPRANVIATDDLLHDSKTNTTSRVDVLLFVYHRWKSVCVCVCMSLLLLWRKCKINGSNNYYWSKFNYVVLLHSTFEEIEYCYGSTCPSSLHMSEWCRVHTTM